MQVSLVIPGRNSARTIGPCLDAVTPMLQRGELTEIIFVDDGSTDDTVEIAAKYPVRLVRGKGRGAGAARNLGWPLAKGDLVWFIDADCVAEPDALTRLLPHLKETKVGAVGGSYGNMRPDALVSCLIHEEILERHRAMSNRVNFLATFNVIYRKQVLEEVKGFDERFLKGQDAELSWRVLAAGYELGFEHESRVRHFHEQALRPYFRVQKQQGYWRVWLHLGHKGHSTGDSYSSIVDHGQPPLAMLALGSLLLLPFPYIRWLTPAPFVLLLLAQAPMTLRVVRRTGQMRYLSFAAMSFFRAFWRGWGMTRGVIDWLRTPRSRRLQPMTLQTGANAAASSSPSSSSATP